MLRPETFGMTLVHFYEILMTKCIKRIRDLLSMRCINLHFTYLFTLQVSSKRSALAMALEATGLALALKVTILGLENAGLKLVSACN